MEYLIVLRLDGKNQLEIYPSIVYKQKIIKSQKSQIIGIAKRYVEALEQVRQITQNVYETTGGTDFRRYFREQKQNLEESVGSV